MRQPPRTQPSCSARLASSTVPSTLPHFATSDEVPEVLERSTLRLSDVKRSAESIADEGILVRLFAVGNSKRTLWIVGSPNASGGYLSNWKDAQKSGAKTSQTTKAGSLHERRARAKITSRKAKGQRLLAKDERKPLMAEQRGKGNDGESDDASDEEEDEAGDDDGDDTDGDEAGEDENEEDEDEEVVVVGTEKPNAAMHVVEEHNAVGKEWSEQDVEEQGADEYNREHEEVQVEEADKGEDGEDEVEEDREKDIEDEEEREKEVEGEKGGEEEGEEEACDKVQKHNETGGEDSADKDEQEGENADDEKAGEERGNHDEVREDREAMEQRVTANNRDGACRDWRLGDTNDKEEEESSIGSGEEERVAGEEDGIPKEGRKRPLEKSEAFGCSTPKDRPNKRSKSDEGESGDGATTDDSPKRTVSPETTPRPRTSSPTSTTASPGSILEIVRQTSVVPGLEDTVSAVWAALSLHDTCHVGTTWSMSCSMRTGHVA